METYQGTGSAEQTTPLVHGRDERQDTTLRVMVAIDESEWSFQALTWALDHLFLNAPSMVEGGEGMVTLVHATQPFQPYVYPDGPGGAVYYPSTSVMESVKKAQEETSASILSRALQICKDRMVKAEALHLTGDPKEMICEATEKMHIDLLVVGNRTWSGHVQESIPRKCEQLLCSPCSMSGHDCEATKGIWTEGVCIIAKVINRGRLFRCHFK